MTAPADKVQSQRKEARLDEGGLIAGVGVPTRRRAAWHCQQRSKSALFLAPHPGQMSPWARSIPLSLCARCRSALEGSWAPPSRRFVVAASAGQLLSHEWLYARLATGLALLAAWPAAIWLGALLCCDARQKPRKLVGAGLFLAALTHLFLWAPVNLLVLAAAAPLLASLVVIWMACSGKTSRLLGVWVFQAVVVATVGAGTFIANTGVAPFKDFAALTQAASAGEKAEAGARTALATGDVPATYHLVWRSTGSSWLDSMGRLVHFEITPTDPSLPLDVEFREAGQIFRSNAMEQYPYGFTHQIVPGRSYSLSVSGDASTQVSVTVQSLFTLVPESP